MDRRQKKSREAIFRAFTQLLCEYRLEKITVSQIIEKADVGRATFYAHFETKDDLTQALCEDLFCHIFDGPGNHTHKHLFACDQPQSLFVHLCSHLQKNDHQILALLVRQKNERFQTAFKREFVKLMKKEPQIMEVPRAKALPEGYWAEFLAESFLGTIAWWHESHMQATPEQVASYFLQAVQL